MLHLPLIPAEAAYRSIIAARNGLYDRGLFATERAPVPAISVGNISVGGTGKTPVSAWVAARLAGWGRRPSIILRGYGSDEVEVHRELNAEIPVFVQANRRVAAAKAVSHGCDCIVLDDGFQHRSIGRDLDIVLISAERWAPPRRLLPRGPWREPLSALGRADFVLVTRKTASRERADSVLDELRWAGYRGAGGIVHLDSGPLLPLATPTSPGDPLDLVRGERVVAVTTLAEPAPFLEHLEAAGAVVRPMIFADHHEFTSDDLAHLIRAVGSDLCVMTRKEAVKVRNRIPPGLRAYFLQQSVAIEAGGSELDAALKRSLEGTG